MPASKELTRTTFRTSRLLDFCSRKELVAQTGHRPEAWPLVALKELVDNALDACEAAGTAPEIEVRVDERTINVSDNGPGVPTETIEDILDFAFRASSCEAYVSPTRGAQGNALKTIVAMPFVLDGELGRVEVSTGDVRHEITLGVDRIRQEPIVKRRESRAEDARNGTSVTVHWPDSACSILHDAESHFLQVADAYTWLNPHLSLTVDWLGDVTTIEATDPGWKKWRPRDPTSARWYTLDHLERLVAAYIAHDADRGGDRTVREFVAEFRGLSSSAKQKRVLDATGLARTSLSALVDGDRLDRAALAQLLHAMQAHSKPVKPHALGVVGKTHLAECCRRAGAEMESFQYRRKAGESDGVPWLVETGFAWLPDAEHGRILVTGVNWSPGIVNPFRELGWSGQSLDSVLVRQRAGWSEPVVFVLHLACPRVEYTDRGKSAVVVGGSHEEEEWE